LRQLPQDEASERRWALHKVRWEAYWYEMDTRAAVTNGIWASRSIGANDADPWCGSNIARALWRETIILFPRFV
jgi:hypothetical protein